MLVSISQLLSQLVNKSPKQSFKESVVANSVLFKSENIWLKIIDESSITLTKNFFKQSMYVRKVYVEYTFSKRKKVYCIVRLCAIYENDKIERVVFPKGESNWSRSQLKNTKAKYKLDQYQL